MAAFNYWVEQTYRYYQFYANTLIAVLWAYIVNRYFETSPLLGLGTDLGVLILCAVLFARVPRRPVEISSTRRTTVRRGRGETFDR